MLLDLCLIHYQAKQSISNKLGGYFAKNGSLDSLGWKIPPLRLVLNQWRFQLLDELRLLRARVFFFLSIVVYTLELALYFQLLFFLIWYNRLNPLLGLFPTFRA